MEAQKVRVIKICRNCRKRQSKVSVCGTSDYDNCGHSLCFQCASNCLNVASSAAKSSDITSFQPKCPICFKIVHSFAVLEEKKEENDKVSRDSREVSNKNATASTVASSSPSTAAGSSSLAAASGLESFSFLLALLDKPGLKTLLKSFAVIRDDKVLTTLVKEVLNAKKMKMQRNRERAQAASTATAGSKASNSNSNALPPPPPPTTTSTLNSTSASFVPDVSNMPKPELTLRPLTSRNMNMNAIQTSSSPLPSSSQLLSTDEQLMRLAAEAPPFIPSIAAAPTQPAPSLPLPLSQLAGPGPTTTPNTATAVKNTHTAPAKVKVEVKAKEEEEEDDDDNMCAVCFDQTVDTLLYPCCHLLCSVCVQQLRRSTIFTAKRGTSCPYCRTTVNAYFDGNTSKEEAKAKYERSNPPPVSHQYQATQPQSHSQTSGTGNATASASKPTQAEDDGSLPICRVKGIHDDAEEEDIIEVLSPAKTSVVLLHKISVNPAPWNFAFVIFNSMRDMEIALSRDGAVVIPRGGMKKGGSKLLRVMKSTREELDEYLDNGCCFLSHQWPKEQNEDCIFWMKGYCGKAGCLFSHDPALKGTMKPVSNANANVKPKSMRRGKGR